MIKTSIEKKKKKLIPVWIMFNFNVKAFLCFDQNLEKATSSKYGSLFRTVVIDPKIKNTKNTCQNL